MTLDEVKQRIQKCATQMQQFFGRPVFDEWILASFRAGDSRLLSYVGPRQEAVGASFADDFRNVRESFMEERKESGAFGFSMDGHGTRFDGFLVLGRDVYLFVNHTEKAIADFQDDPAWRTAQEPFVELSEAVRSDPVTV